MPDTPLISFVLPAFKEQFLEESIASILNQTYSNIELIVVDDYSPENIAAIVDAFSDDRLSYYRNPVNIGGGDLVAQWNKCLGYAHGEWVVLATDDDVYAPSFLEDFMSLLPSHPEVDLFRARICSIDSKGAILDVERCYEQYLTVNQFFYEMLVGMKGGIPQYIFRREKLVAHGGFVNLPKAWGSDDATAIMMSANGVLSSQRPLVSFRWSGQNISTAGKYGPEKVQARIEYNRWVMKRMPASCPQGGFEGFYSQMIQQRLGVELKIKLIHTINTLPFRQKVSVLWKCIKGCDLYSTRDKLSIILRCVLKK